MTVSDGESDVGTRIELLLAELASGVRGPEAAALGEQLVTLIVGWYGEALGRIVEVVGADITRRLADDPLVTGVLVLHDLHPLSVEQRVEAALHRVRPRLGAHADDVVLLGIDSDGTARFRLDAEGAGCAAHTLRSTLEEAVLSAAPELSGVAVEERPPAPKLLQIGRRVGV